MLADVGDLYHIGIDAGSLGCLAECILMHSGGTGTDHDPCQGLLLNGLPDFQLSCLGTHILVVLRVNDPRLLRSCLNDTFDVYRRCNVRTAMTDKYSYSLHFFFTSCLFAVFAERTG